jgi:hypothetical protein
MIKVKSGRSPCMPFAGLARLAGLLALACAQAGCASLSYVDSGGARHVVGLVALTLPPSAAGEAVAMTLTTVGLSVRTGGDGEGQATLGFSHDRLVSVPANACVDLNAPGPCRDLAARPARDEMLQKEP